MTRQLFEDKHHKLTHNKLGQLLGIVLFVAHSLAIADDYLDSLTSEAADLEYLDETQPANAITSKYKSTDPEITKAIQDISRFEIYFRNQDSADAAIYFRLTTQQRLRVFHRFQTTQNLDIARKMTIEIFNQQR